MESVKVFQFDANTIHPSIQNKQYDIVGSKSYRIYNCKNTIGANVSEEVSQYRSVITSHPEDIILSFSLPHKSCFQSVTQNASGSSLSIYMNEFIEGPMVHLFYDHRIQSWEIATKSAVGGYYPLDKYTSTTNKPDIYVRSLFCDLFAGSKLEQMPCLDNLSKDHCYQFIMQHPKQDPFAKGARLYLISVFHLCNNTVKYIPPPVFMHWECFQNTPILFPELIDVDQVNNESDLEYCCIRNHIPGLVIHNTQSGTHHIYKSRCLIEKNASLYIDPSVFYRFLYLTHCDMVGYYLQWNQHHTSLFTHLQSYMHNIISSIYNHYVAFHITKTIDVLDDKYKYYVDELHREYYLKYLAKKWRRSITKSIVYDYFMQLSPEQQLYACCYEKRQNIMS